MNTKHMAHTDAASALLFNARFPYGTLTTYDPHEIAQDAGMSDRPAFTKSQIDRLGDRLRHGEQASVDDTELLAAYQHALRRPLLGAMTYMLDVLQEVLPAHTGGMTARTKQLRSIVAKLRREKTRLSSMQDLMGFRVIVPRIVDQEALVQRIEIADGWRIIDRRWKPPRGYRAVHASA
jgi:ppGpp synthetase/RelA/SpoT-type nucleotidyltranferase